MRNIITGIDIGTSKVCTAVGYLNEEYEPVVLGEGICRYSGMKKGRITDVGEIASAIKDSVSRAERHAKVKVNSAYVNIIGLNVEIIKRNVSIEIENNLRTITINDVYRLLNVAGDITIPEGKKVIDIVVENYKIDDSKEISNPIGMSGSKLELTADLVLADNSLIQNITNSMQKAGIQFEGFIMGALSEGGLVLTADEKEKGAILINTGAGITDISVFENNSLQFYNSLPVGGEHVTNDLSIVLKTSYNDAEKIKKQYELSKVSMVQNDQEVRLSGQDLFSQRTVMVSEIIEIIEARVSEILTLAKEEIVNFGVEIKKDWTLVLSGEGISEFHGVAEIAEEIFDTNVRISRKRINEDLNPIYNTAIGIIKYVSDMRRNKSNEIITIRGNRSKRKKSIFKKIKDFF